MATGAQTKETTTTTTQEPAKTTTAPPEPTKTTAKAAESQEPVKQTKGAAEGTQEPAKGGLKKATLGGDDDIPADADLIELSATALNRRLARHSKKELREHFGTDDPAEIKGKLEKLSKLEAKAEEDRQKQLTKEQKLQEERDAAIARAEAAELREAAEKEDRVIDREDGRLKELAGGHIKMKFWKHVAKDLAEHLSSEFTEEQLESLKDKDIDKWFAGYLKENPEYAKEAAKEEVKKEPLTNSVRDDNRPTPEKGGPSGGGKSFKPGGPNSMNPQEAAAEARKQGYSWR